MLEIYKKSSNSISLADLNCGTYFFFEGLAIIIGFRK